MSMEFCEYMNNVIYNEKPTPLSVLYWLLVLALRCGSVLFSSKIFWHRKHKLVGFI
jgi:hypothetical protein